MQNSFKFICKFCIVYNGHHHLQAVIAAVPNRESAHSGMRLGVPLKGSPTSASPFFSAMLCCSCEADAHELRTLLSNMLSVAIPHLRFVGNGLLVSGPSPATAAAVGHLHD